VTGKSRRASSNDMTFDAPTGVHRTDDGSGTLPALVTTPAVPPPATTEPFAVPQQASVPPAQKGRSFAAPIDQIAPNPLNTRDIGMRPEKLAQLRASLAEHGQIEACAAVTRRAFLALFSEYEQTIGHATWVQVTGGSRRAALLAEGEKTIDTIVRDNLASSRAGFISATAHENIKRDDLDVIEEAKVVHQLLAELDSGNAVAEYLGEKPPWVTVRKNLLLLDEQVQAAMRIDDERRRLPLREVRNWHVLTPEQQITNLESWRRRRGFTDKPGVPPVPKPAPVTRVQAAIRKLGDTPAVIGATLRAELPLEDRRILAEELLRD
jgi:ParB family chromosome partitioning protein